MADASKQAAALRKRIGRPPKPPPAHVVATHRESPPGDACELIEDLAADGWSIVGIAWKLGTSKDTLKRWFAEAPALLEAFEVGRERERKVLHNEAFRMAMECEEPTVKLRAIMFLCNSRHGYTNAPADDAVTSRFNVTINNTINLPGDRPVADFVVSEAGS